MLKRLLYILLSLSVCMMTLSACTGREQYSDSTSEADSTSGAESNERTPVELPPSVTLQFRNELEGIYNYCPSIMQVDDTTAYIYYCTNQKSYEIVDYVGCRKGTRREDGSWSFGEESIVFSPSKNQWDSHHTCDPSVVKGSFRYNGESYEYLMAYLGCSSYDNQDNEIGLAVAKTPEGPFIRVGTEPFIAFEYAGTDDHWEWGVGQASLINMDKESRITIFYTRGSRAGTAIIVEEWDLSDLSAPKKLASAQLSSRGLLTLNGDPDNMNNADFVYDAKENRFYAVSEAHPYPSSEPNYISSDFRVTYFDKNADYDQIEWETLAFVGREETKLMRNHNPGILRDAYGHLSDPYLSVFFTNSTTGSDSLWSYKILDYYLQLP